MKELKINVQRLENVLEKLFLFKSLEQGMKERFIDESVLVIAEKGETLIEEGALENTIYILIEGEVEVKTVRDGEEFFLSMLKPNAIIGEISAMTRKPRTATVTAATPCSLIKVKAELVQQIIQKNPTVKMLLEAVRKGRERDTEEKLSDEQGFEEEAD
jgi:ATP-binding cassette subfamily B protein